MKDAGAQRTKRTNRHDSKDVMDWNAVLDFIAAKLETCMARFGTVNPDDDFVRNSPHQSK